MKYLFTDVSLNKNINTICSEGTLKAKSGERLKSNLPVYVLIHD